jgi:hypothetical protein
MCHLKAAIIIRTDDADISSRTKKGRTATLPGPLNIGSRELSRAMVSRFPWVSA